MRTIFLGKSNIKGGWETIPRPLYKKSKLSISQDRQSEMLVFILSPSGGLPKYNKTKVLTTCFDLI